MFLFLRVEAGRVGGNREDMLLNIGEIASDLEFRGSVACPTIRLDGLTVAGGPELVIFQLWE